MRAIDAIKLCADLIGDNKLKSTTEKFTSDTELDAQEKKQLNYYTSVFNLALRTIASEDLPLVKLENVLADENGKVYYRDFSEEVFMIKDVVDKKKNMRAQFFALPFSVYLPEGNREYLIKYFCFPTKIENLLAEAELPPYYTEDLVALLMASDILLALSSLDDHTFFLGEYKKKVSKIKFNLSGRMTIPTKALI